MGTESTSTTQMELKYCERCGGLWLRPLGDSHVYCSSCSPAMAELPPASSVRKRVVLGGQRRKAKYTGAEAHLKTDATCADTVGGAN
jgi:hypothetical protein